jgi:hypothetical protein
VRPAVLLKKGSEFGGLACGGDALQFCSLLVVESAALFRFSVLCHNNVELPQIWLLLKL